MSRIEVQLVSPPDRENLAIHLMVDHEQLAEVNQESDTLAVEIYGRRDGQPWVIEFDELAIALKNAKERLAGTSAAE